ncbi:MAG TPA: archease [Gemmatimonadaceae bacterium]|jgi:SHS2 domain-containing protein
MRSKARTEEHVGEFKVSLTADTLEELFAETARVIAREAGTPLSTPSDWGLITVGARDRTTLLADWANELLGRSEVERRAYTEIRNLSITMQPDGTSSITAEVRSQPVTRWTSPLKAATYHGLSLERHDGEWHAVILFDV